jgi:hypothetical protein
MVCSSIFLQAQVITTYPYIQSFNDSTLNGWKIPNPTGSGSSPHNWRWQKFTGIDSSACVKMKLPAPKNVLRSPGFVMQAGVQYAVYFNAKVASSSSSRRLKVFANQADTFFSSSIILDTVLANNGYTQLNYLPYIPKFTPTVSDTFYFQFFVDTLLGANVTNGYLDTYLDSVRVEQNIFPIIAIDSPANNITFLENYDDSTKIMLKATANDADGQVLYVDFFANGIKLGRDSVAPYTYLWKDALPGNYAISASAMDNRGNLKTTTQSNQIVIQFSNATLKPYIQWDFNVNNPNGAGLDYWNFYPTYGTGTGDYRLNGMFRATNGLYNYSVTNSDNYAASPSFYLKAGLSYNLEFIAKSNSGAQVYRFLLGGQPNLIDTILIDTSIILQASIGKDYDYIHNKTFSVQTSGVYHLLIYKKTSINIPYIQCKFDNIRIIGDSLNAGPLAKFISPAKSFTTAENSRLKFRSSALDVDGSVSKIEYYADNMLVAQSTIPPNFEAIWQSLPTGSFNLRAKSFDNKGVYNWSQIITTSVLNNQFKSSDFIGSNDIDRVRGTLIKENNELILAGDFGALIPIVATTIYLNGANASTKGTIIRMTPDGKKIISVTRFAQSISDISKDQNDYLYVACGAEGIIKLNPKATAIVWQVLPTITKFTHRIDVSPSGYVSVFEMNQSNPELGNLSGGSIKLYQPNGAMMVDCGGIAQYNSDVCIDEKTQTVVGIGFFNFNTWTGGTNGSVQPVYVPSIRAFDFSGNQKWLAYNWSNDSASTRWLNKSNNNMADARLNRCTIGKDGKLYVLGQVYGGNHLFRYDPFNIMLAGKMAIGGDTYFNLANTGTETHAYWGKHDVATGAILKSQSLTGRLDNTKGNSIIVENGAIDADEDGNVYVTGATASGMPMAIDYLPGEYTGGGLIFKVDSTFISRKISCRLATSAYGHAICAKNKSQMLVAGSDVSSEMYITQPALQGSLGLQKEGWYALVNNEDCAQTSLNASIAMSNSSVKKLSASHIMMTINCALIAKVEPLDSLPLLDSLVARVWVDNAPTNHFLQRHYEVNSFGNNGIIKTGFNRSRITLYATQQEFDNYNAVEFAKLPTNTNDALGKARLQIVQFAGQSNNGSGNVMSYAGIADTIHPIDSQIVFNALSNRWEITFDADSVSGFFITTKEVVPNTILSAKAFIAGYYDPIGNLMNDAYRVNNYLQPQISIVPFVHVNNSIPDLMPSAALTTTGNDAIVDWVFLSLMKPQSPLVVQATRVGLLQRDGDIVSVIDGISPIDFGLKGDYYYVSIKHRNAIETWTSQPIYIHYLPSSYDFTTSASKAFGSNQIQVATNIWAFYNGDMDANGLIDNDDFSLWELDATNFNAGMLPTDLNGDATIDNSDFSIWEFNANDFVGKIVP